MVLTPNELTIEPIQLQGEIDRRSLESLSRTDLDWRKQMLTESKAPFFCRVSALLQVDRWLPQDAAPDHTLIVAGCEPFIHVPLATLGCASGERLVERAVLRHAPSWNVAAHLCTRRARHVREAVKPLLVAPVSFGGRHPALPASAAEVEALRALWPHSDTLLQD